MPVSLATDAALNNKQDVSSHSKRHDRHNYPP